MERAVLQRHMKRVLKKTEKYYDLIKVGIRLSLAALLSICCVFGMSVSEASAYSIDYEMDQARGEKTIEYYGESLREIVEQTLRNNDGHPEPKETAQNSYRRQGFLNDVLPQKRKSAFDKDRLMQLRQTENPKDRLR